MSEANCIIEIPPHVEFAKEGEMVTILPLAKDVYSSNLTPRYLGIIPQESKLKL